MSPWKLKQAGFIIKSGGVIAYPTEAVYGLGCDPLREAAVRRILQMKRRPAGKGLILIAADISQVMDFIEFDNTSMAERVMATWPGPVTWLLPATPAAPAWIRGQHTTIAVRVSAHPLVQALCRTAGPLVSTSANPANHPPARTPYRVISYFGRQVDMVVHGALGAAGRKPTEIRDARTGQIIRRSG